MEKDYRNGRCCVFQPFDKGVFDKRFDDVLVPAIEKAFLEPYRVDRDAGSTIPIDTLHSEIRAASLCIADITTRNPNVMYELGYALAAGKDVVIISAPSTEKYPFDIQHRGILSYSVDSPSDFTTFSDTLTTKLFALIERQEKARSAIAFTPVKSTHGLQPHEVTVLALLLANSDSTDELIAASWLKGEMKKANFTDVGTRLGLVRLTQLGYVKTSLSNSGYGEYWAYRLTESGEAWLLENQDKLEVRSVRDVPSYSSSVDVGISDDDIPF